MEVKPQYDSVGEFFKYQPAYRVPAYQRAYSWEKLEIEDFLRDLETCYNKRKYSNPTVHFFGQIVCIGDLQGANQNKAYELVDGQQRIATFILLVYALVNTYKQIIEDGVFDDDNGNQKKVLERRIEDLTTRYLVFQMEINEEFQDVSVLVLSNRDRIFFESFLKDTSTRPEKESHKLIKKAYDLIRERISDLTHSASVRDRIGNLKTIFEILESDFHILNMVTSDRKAAFKLFQVLNNRGKSLTEGDLLRAECLRMLESHRLEQQIAEEAWDNILTDPPADTEQYLRAIYGSHTGEKNGTNSLFNEFLTKFLPEYGHDHIDSTIAIRTKDQVKAIEEDIVILRQISAGQWPYEPRLPVEQWDRNKLELLIDGLGHKECLPFLLSAKLLNHRIFSEIIHILERFVFRYLVIGNQYIGDLLTIYVEEAKIIRDDPASYSSAALLVKLRPLMARVEDPMFRRLLEDFKYTRSGKSNKPLKYFLLSVAYYYQWYIDGATSSPTYTEKQIVYDFTDSTIEHVYPYSGVGAVVNANLELVKNNLGNLTILSNTDNRGADSDDFPTKIPIYRRSALTINREDIAVKRNWDRQIIDDRTEELKNMACAIFRL